MTDYEVLTREELREWMNERKDFVLIDTLGPESYEDHHLPSAKMVDAHEDDFVEKVEEIADKDDTVVVYCYNFDCGLSHKAAEALVDAGFENVYDFDGGIEAWEEKYDLHEGKPAEHSTKTCEVC